MCQHDLHSRFDLAFSFLKKISAVFQSFLTCIKFDKHNKLQLHIVSLYGTIIELTGTCILLVEEDYCIGIPILERTTLEAYVDIINLINNPNYIFRLQLNYLEEWIKPLDSVKNNGNKYLKSLINVDYSEFESEKKSLIAEKYKPISTKSKFVCANLTEEYFSIYNALCCHSHNDLRALIDRHWDAEEGISITVFKEQSKEKLLMYLCVNIDILTGVSNLLHKYFKSSKENDIQAYEVEWQNLLKIITTTDA